MLKQHVLLEVIRRLAIGNAPGALSSLRVVAPNFAALCGTSPLDLPTPTEADAEKVERLTRLLSWPASDIWDNSDVVLSRFRAFLSAACHADHPMLLVLPALHRFVEGEPHPYAIDLAFLLIPALARREIQLLGTSHLAEFRQYIERNAGIQCRVQATVPRKD